MAQTTTNKKTVADAHAQSNLDHNEQKLWKIR